MNQEQRERVEAELGRAIEQIETDQAHFVVAVLYWLRAAALQGKDGQLADHLLVWARANLLELGGGR